MKRLLPAAHIVSAILANRLLFRDRRVIPAVIGGLLPDAVDTTLAWVLCVTPSRHSIGHTLLAGVGFSAVAAGLVGDRTAAPIGSAYLLHLVVDDIHHGRVPWLMPFSNRTRRPHRQGLARLGVWGIGIALELPFLLLLWRLLVKWGTPEVSGSASRGVDQTARILDRAK